MSGHLVPRVPCGCDCGRQFVKHEHVVQLEVLVKALFNSLAELLEDTGMESRRRATKVVRDWQCATCREPMQFKDGICFACNGGKDPGD